MKFKNRVLIYSFITFFASFFAVSTPVLAAEPAETAQPAVVAEAASSAIAPYSDIIEYRYKEVNGKVYRRLFNYSRDEWAEPYWHLVG